MNSTTQPSALARLASWLLDLEEIKLGEGQQLNLFWETTLPLWLMVLVMAMAVFAVGSIYRRERGGIGRRFCLAGLRVGLIGLVVLLLCGPVLQLQRNRTEPSHVALLIDISRSMTVSDIGGVGDDGTVGKEGTEAGRHEGTQGVGYESATGRPSRIDRVRRALLSNNAAALRGMLARNRLEVFAFDGRLTRTVAIDEAQQIPLVAAALERLQCKGTTTDLPGAIKDVIDRQERGRLAAIVVASDGRSTVRGSLAEAIARATSRRIPIYSIPVGSVSPQLDLAVRAVAVEDQVFLKDLVDIQVEVEAEGLAAPTRVTVRLVNPDDDRTVASTAIELIPSTLGDLPRTVSATVNLVFKPKRIGRADYRVEIVPVEGERRTDNNSRKFQVSVFDDQIRVLYVESYPRYEYRFLKNTLLREPTIRSSCLLLSADANFAQEGTDPIRRFPESPEELAGYDVVLFGDVDPNGDWISPAQLEMLVEHVSRDGVGFGLIAGPRYAPHTFRGTPLEKLLPVRIDPEFLGTYNAALEDAFAMTITEQGARSRLFRFMEGTEGRRDEGTEARRHEGTEGSAVRQAYSSSAHHAPTQLGGLYWLARTLGAKPGAEVLAVRDGGATWRFEEDSSPRLRSGLGLGMRSDPGGMPVIVTSRYGAGRVLFVGTDDSWRWRRGGSEWVFDSYWLGVCRMLMKPRGSGADRRITLRTDRRRYRFGQRVEVNAAVLDAELLATVGLEMNLLVLDDRDRPTARVSLSRLSERSSQFEGSFVPSAAGGYSLQLQDITPLPGRRRVSSMIRVDDVDVEMRSPQADHESLTRIAAETGGAVMSLNNIAELAGAIQDRSVQIPDDLSEPLWDSRLALACFVLLVVTEWVLRKAFGMV